MQFTEKFLLTLIALGFFIFIPGFLHSFSFKSPNIKQTETPPFESSSTQVSTSNDFDPIYDDSSNSDSEYYDEEEARRDEIAEEIRRPWSQPLMMSDDEFDMMGNPFEVLGAYPRIDVKFFNTGDNIGPSYDMANYQLIHDENYCNMVDAYNVAHPENMFENRNIFTDFSDGEPRNEVLDKIGNVTMKGFNMPDTQRDALKRKYHLDYKITNFFVNYKYFHFYHEIGKSFLCATQMYNRIPGYESLTRKDLSLNSLRHYEDQFQNKPQCLPKNMFPQSYRLFYKEECQNFFDLIHSEEFLRTQDNLQYMLKVGYGPEKSNGITLLYQTDLADLDALYDEDQKCGSLNKPFIVQKYVSQPLLLDKGNKFDLTVFMLIASTNPLIVYYHDGLLRASLNSYDTASRDKNVHLTCTHLSKEIFQEAKDAFDNMAAQELMDYHLWTFERLEEYLREAGVINDSKWLETFIRPALQKAFVHLVRMSKQGFLKQSNVYQLFQVDFLLDNDLNLWHVKTHPTPPFDLESKTSSKLIVSMLQDLFEIQYAYYQSRMKRLMEVMTEMQDRLQVGEDVDYEKQKAKYREASKNRLESEYEISKRNSWTLIVDENLPRVEAYFGHLSEECV